MSIFDDLVNKWFGKSSPNVEPERPRPPVTDTPTLDDIEWKLKQEKSRKERERQQNLTSPYEENK